MEVICGTQHTEFPVGDASRVGEARRHAAELAQDCGFSEVDAGRLAIIVTELGTNLLRHAQDGRLLVAVRAERREVEVIAVDRGPGMGDVERSLHDGFSTGSTPGTGLGAVRRQAQDFDIHSERPAGTVVVARVRPSAGSQGIATRAFSVSAIGLPAPGEKVCGDAWGFASEGEQAWLIVADGLGHGPDAAEASAAAIEVFAREPAVSPRELLQRTHVRLRATRGAAVMTLHADGGAAVVRSAGAGNVMARLVSGVSDRTILGQHGTAGVTIRTPEESTTAWPPHALLVVWSDGIESRWKSDLLVPVLGRDPALAAAILWRDHGRGRDDATVAVVRRNVA